MLSEPVGNVNGSDLLTRKGYLIEERGMSYLTETDPDLALGSPQAAAWTYRIALGPRGGQKVLSLHAVPTQEAPPTPVRCVNEQGFSFHAEVCCAAASEEEARKPGPGIGPAGRAERQHCAPTSPAPPSPMNRLALNRAGQVVLTVKTPYREGATHNRGVTAGIPYNDSPRCFPVRGCICSAFMACSRPKSGQEGPAWRPRTQRQATSPHHSERPGQVLDVDLEHSFEQPGPAHGGIGRFQQADPPCLGPMKGLKMPRSQAEDRYAPVYA